MLWGAPCCCIGYAIRQLLCALGLQCSASSQWQPPVAASKLSADCARPPHQPLALPLSLADGPCAAGATASSLGALQSTAGVMWCSQTAVMPRKVGKVMMKVAVVVVALLVFRRVVR